MTGFGSALCCLLLLAALMPLAAASAQTLRPRDFNIDLVTGPIVGPNSTIALGGAYTALGFGIEAAALTPAAYAARTLWDTNWFEFDLTVGYSPGASQVNDFDNNGDIDESYQNYYALTGGALFHFGEFGLGGIVRAQNYRVGARMDLGLILANYGAGYMFFDGQLLIAGSARSAFLTLEQFSEGRTLAFYSGTGPELGVVLALADRPYRIGVAGRTAVLASESKSTGTAQDYALPRDLRLPAELQVGLSYQFGPRPLNRRWINPHDTASQLRDALNERRHERMREQARRERSEARLRRSLDTGPAIEAVEADWQWATPQDPEFWRSELARYEAEELQLERDIDEAQRAHVREVRALSRTYLMLSLDALWIAPTANGIGLQSFLGQKREPAGRSSTVSLRFGAEGEPIPDRLKLRMGSYLEPSRFAEGAARVHGTFGAEVKLFAWDVLGLIEPVEWKIGGAVDIAVRYLNYGVSIGVWH